MWGVLPEIVLINRLSGLQAADWYEKIGNQRSELASQIAELGKSPLARRIIDLGRLQTAIETWPKGGWHTAEVFHEYNLALTRGVANGRVLRLAEQWN